MGAYERRVADVAAKIEVSAFLSEEAASIHGADYANAEPEVRDTFAFLSSKAGNVIAGVGRFLSRLPDFQDQESKLREAGGAFFNGFTRVVSILARGAKESDDVLNLVYASCYPPEPGLYFGIGAERDVRAFAQSVRNCAAALETVAKDFTESDAQAHAATLERMLRRSDTQTRSLPELKQEITSLADRLKEYARGFDLIGDRFAAELKSSEAPDLAR